MKKPGRENCFQIMNSPLLSGGFLKQKITVGLPAAFVTPGAYRTSVWCNCVESVGYSSTAEVIYICNTYFFPNLLLGNFLHMLKFLYVTPQSLRIRLGISRIFNLYKYTTVLKKLNLWLTAPRGATPVN